jgi:hypothetical protein
VGTTLIRISARLTRDGFRIIEIEWAVSNNQPFKSAPKKSKKSKSSKKSKLRESDGAEMQEEANDEDNESVSRPTKPASKKGKGAGRSHSSDFGTEVTNTKRSCDEVSVESPAKKARKSDEDMAESDEDEWIAEAPRRSRRHRKAEVL